MSETTQSIRLTDAQLKPAIEVMGKAFLNDPFLCYLVPDEQKRARVTPEFVAIVVRYCFHYGQVWTVPSVAGVACWLTPGKTSPSFWGMMRTGMLTMPLQFGWAGFQRFSGVINYTEQLHKQFAVEPHWYLWGLGVEPVQQGRGLGGQLIQPVLALADEARQPCYLETQNERNLPFYQRHGFAVMSDGVVPGSDFRVWAMVRPAKLA